MAQGAPGQNFLKSAEQGRIEHRATASAAAAAMNTVKPNRGDNYSQEYQNFVNSGDPEVARLFPDAGRVNAVSAPTRKEPMKINIGAQGNVASSLNADSSTFIPSEESGRGGPQDFGGAAELQAQAAQAMLAAQMGGMGMYGGMGFPMGMPPAPMGFGPWGMGGYPPMMDPSFMMGKGGMAGMYPGMYPGMGSPSGKAAGGMYGGNGGGKGKNKGNAGDKKGDHKERRKRGAKGGRPPSPPPVESEEANANRSEKLNEVRKNHGKCKFSLAEVMPHVLEFAKDQHGSRFLQTKLDESGEADRAEVFEAILPHTKVLASDVFGNFVVQKLFDICQLEQKKQLAEQLQGEVLKLANETYGCRVIQKALHLLSREMQQQLALELKDHVPTCIENMHGNHVIQKCIEQMPPDSVTFIINAVNAKVEVWASHMYGCRVIQRLLEHCTSIQLPRMLDSILECAKKLSMDSYGNYVVQHMLEHGRKEDKAKILQIVALNISEFSKHKCSSNVVEKCFEIAAIGEHATQLEQDRSGLYIAVLGGPLDQSPPLLQMLDDRFGNYIVQRMIEYSKGDDRVLLHQKLLSVEHILKNSNNGKHILSALHKEFGG